MEGHYVDVYSEARGSQSVNTTTFKFYYICNFKITVLVKKAVRFQHCLTVII